MKKQKTTLTFYGGVNEIGGNKILLEDKKVRIFFDFGRSFSMGDDYFTGWLKPRSKNGLGDYFEFNLLPKIKGLYSKKQLTFTDLSYTKPEIDAVFLSHAHTDHIEHIKFLDEKIPIRCGYGTKIFIESMEETSPFNLGEHPYETFRTGDEIEIGHLVVEPIHVDHSIPASYGFIIHTPEGAIVYTGDLRAHGPRKEMTEEFAEKTYGSEPIAMISEGTRMVEEERRKNYSELEVEKLSNEIVSATKKIVFVTHYGKRKKTGGFLKTDYYIWERRFMEKMVNHEFVHKHQSEIVMDLDFYQFAELIDIKPDPDSHFIHSTSEPYSEEDIEDEVMHNWLDHFKIKFHQLHASGHMNRQQLTDLISYIKPKKSNFIHSTLLDI